MHELPITQSIVNICKEEVEKHNMEKVVGINLVIGELTGLIPDTIEYYFDIISKDTPAFGARINVKKIPVGIKCSECGAEFQSARGVYSCLKCGSEEIRISGGREFLIESLEME